MSGFRVGDEVVCVDTGWSPESGSDAPMLEQGAVYVLTEVSVDPYWDLPFVNVEGVAAPHAMGFCPSRFRKVHRTKTDLSIEAFSTIKPGYEEPKRERVKRGVGV